MAITPQTPRSAPGRTPRSPGIAQPVSAIQDTLNRVLPTYATGYVRPRGLLVPVDPWLRGTLRWARKFGGSAGSVWRPDITMTLDQVLNSGDTRLYVRQIPDSLLTVLTGSQAFLAGRDPDLAGIVLEISPTLRVHIDEWDLQAFTLAVRTTESVTETLAAGQPVRVWGFPLSIEGGWPDSSNVFRVCSPSLRLTTGDLIQIPVAGDWRYTSPVRVRLAELVETDSEGYKYQITIDLTTDKLPRDLVSNEIVYARAFPAYLSGLIPLPDYSAQQLRVTGPFLVDFASGPLVKNVRYTEYVSLRQFRNDRSPITPLLPAGHNAQANVEPIQAEQFLFWKPVKGTLNYDKHTGDAVLTCDQDGLFRVVEPLAPAMTVPTTYAIGTVVAVAPAQLLNNEQLVIDDIYGPQTFEFHVTDPFTPAAGTVIDVSTMTTADEVAAAVYRAVVTSTLEIDVTQIDNILYLTNRNGGVLGNIAITTTVADTGFVVVGMAGGGGQLRWLFSLWSPVAAEAYVRLHPNPVGALPEDGDTVAVLLPGDNVVAITLDAVHAVPITHIDLRIKTIPAVPGAELRMGTWSNHGSRTSFIQSDIVVEIDNNHWAGSCLFVKPLWPTLDLLRVYPNVDRLNAGGLLL